MVQCSDWRHQRSLTESEGEPTMRSLAEVAQLVEHGTENAGVPSSTLGLSTTS